MLTLTTRTDRALSKLEGHVLEAVQEYLANPCGDTWAYASGKVIRRGTTMWVALREVFPDYPESSPRYWDKFPSEHEIVVAIENAFDMGSLEKPASFTNIETYLYRFSKDMGTRLEAGLAPLFDPAKDKLSPEVQAILDDPKDFDRPKPAQLLAIEGTLRTIRDGGDCHLNGEQGSGKTPMGAWVIRALSEYLGDPIRVVLTCPGQLVKKWASHVLRIIPDARVTIVGGYRDLVGLADAGAPQKTEVWIIGRDRGKLSYAWRPGINRRRRIERLQDEETGDEYTVEVDTFHCPRCGAKVQVEEKGKWVDAGIEHFANAKGKPSARRKCEEYRRSPSGGLVLNARGEPIKCGEPLWQAFNGTKDRFTPELPTPGVAPRRCSPVEFCWRQKIRFDLYIADEVHENQGGDTAQGHMFGWFAALSERVVCSTGTMTGGYAANLLNTLWRTDPSRMVADGLSHGADGEKEFIKQYGVLQTTVKYTQKNVTQTLQDLCLGRGQKKSRQEKSLPGISPQLFTRFLMSKSVFVRLAEMHDALPPFEETVHNVPLRADQADLLDEMTTAFDAHCRRMKASGEPCRAWSSARSCFLRWADRPYPAYTIWDRDRENNRIKAFDVPELPANIEYPKELRLRRLIMREKLRGRKVCVFSEMSGPVWDVSGRLSDYLNRYGVRVLVLKSESEGGPSPADRDDWIKERIGDYDVLLCNPHLVKTGLDLYATPTIIFHFTGYSLYTLRQASRRAWRLGQAEDCEVHYLTYRKADKFVKAKNPDFTCLQSACMSLMATKMASSLALEGEFSAEGLAALSESEDMASQLARVIAGTLETEDPRIAMAKYRAKLEAMMPSIVRKPIAATEPAPAPIPFVPEPEIPREKGPKFSGSTLGVDELSISEKLTIADSSPAVAEPPVVAAAKPSPAPAVVNPPAKPKGTVVITTGKATKPKRSVQDSLRDLHAALFGN